MTEQPLTVEYCERMAENCRVWGIKAAYGMENREAEFYEAARLINLADMQESVTLAEHFRGQAERLAAAPRVRA